MAVATALVRPFTIDIAAATPMIPRRGRPRAQGRHEGALALHRAPLSVHQHLAIAVGAVELPLEGALDAELADERGAGVGGAIDVLQVLLADRADVAERVYRELAVRIPAGLARLDVESLELEAPHRKARDILVRHAQPDRHAVEAAARLDGALELADVLGADELKLHEPRECVLEIRHFLGDHLELIGGLGAGDHLAVAVENQPAV